MVCLLNACSDEREEETGNLGHGVEYTITHNDPDAMPIKANTFVKALLGIYVNDSMIVDMYKGYPRYQIVASEIDAIEQNNFLSLILLKAKKGDSIYVQLNLDSTRTYAYLPTKESGYIKMYIKVLDVFTNRSDTDKDEAASIDAYKKIERNNLKKKIEKTVSNLEETEDGIFIERIQAAIGDNVSVCKDSCKVTVRYEMRLLSGVLFDETYTKMKPFSVSLNTQKVIPGFEYAIKKMSVGETIKAYIPSTLAYGAKGSKLGEVPPFEAVVIKITLEKVTHAHP